ncbi:hypothetical protein [Chlamydiifrater phoenicopteri]|uniref:hypothetical protein n=1 Tax=Chlamydiifrater phoenicopteri TaxID=2681469 RepID=UPI001BCDC097|nr:hypothetical protein [Chlamydiifrater phoenicopteri]
MLKKIYKVFFAQYVLLCSQYLLSFIVKTLKHSGEYMLESPKHFLVLALIDSLKEIDPLPETNEPYKKLFSR